MRPLVAQKELTVPGEQYFPSGQHFPVLSSQTRPCIAEALGLHGAHSRTMSHTLEPHAGLPHVMEVLMPTDPRLSVSIQRPS